MKNEMTTILTGLNSVHQKFIFVLFYSIYIREINMTDKISLVFPLTMVIMPGLQCSKVTIIQPCFWFPLDVCAIYTLHINWLKLIIFK